MTMDASSNCRESVSSITCLQLSVEQWELLRRLRNSHLSKLQIIRAYDELDRLDRELGNLFNVSSSTNSLNEPVSPSTMNQNSPPSSISGLNTKRTYSHSVNGRSSNGYSVQHSSSNGNLRPLKTNSNEINQHEIMSTNELEEETRELQELLSKGDAAIHNEISVFVYRYDLKQSQIARMAAVNQAYVSKFLRGDLFDLSENGRMAICRWYIRYKKIVQSMGGAPPSVELLANLTSSSSEPSTKMARLSDSQTNMNSSPNGYDAPKRTRFTFRPEHLDILEKAFLDNPYPDPRRREDIARICNEARSRIDGSNELLNERDRVTDAIVTHWFQNKRKMTKSQRASLQDDSLQLTISNSNNTHDYENGNGSEDDVHISHSSQQKNNMPTIDIDSFEPSSAASLLDPQMAAYRAIMSRMVPFGNNINGTNSSRRYVKQEPILNHDESSPEDGSNSQSSLNDRLSP